MSSNSDAKDREGGDAYKAPRLSLSIRDFNIISRIGDGSFSSVVLARQKDSGKPYAIKIICKNLVIRNKATTYIKNERNILDKLDYEGVAKLCFTFQDADNLYMGLEYIEGGELYYQVSKRGGLPLADARFYAAEIVLVLEYLREQQIIHRDLKPENLLLSATGHLKLIDFGSARALFLPPSETSRGRACSFVGTAEYIAPEVLNNKPVSFATDLWALGCLIFQMITGKPPFKGASEYLTFQLVSERQFDFPPDFPDSARDLVDRLLQLEPEERIGASDPSEVRAHPFFEGTPWDTLRDGAAPDFLSPTPPSAADDALDWEVTSLMRGEPVVYECTD